MQGLLKARLPRGEHMTPDRALKAAGDAARSGRGAHRDALGGSGATIRMPRICQHYASEIQRTKPAPAGPSACPWLHMRHRPKAGRGRSPQPAPPIEVNSAPAET